MMRIFAIPSAYLHRHSCRIITTMGTASLCLALLMFNACSLTDKLPEGEQLYTGVKRVTYHLPTTSNNSNGKSQAASDSAGVITSIANA